MLLQKQKRIIFHLKEFSKNVVSKYIKKLPMAFGGAYKSTAEHNQQYTIFTRSQNNAVPVPVVRGFLRKKFAEAIDRPGQIE